MGFRRIYLPFCIAQLHRPDLRRLDDFPDPRSDAAHNRMDTARRGFAVSRLCRTRVTGCRRRGRIKATIWNGWSAICIFPWKEFSACRWTSPPPLSSSLPIYGAVLDHSKAGEFYVNFSLGRHRRQTFGRRSHRDARIFSPRRPFRVGSGDDDHPGLGRCAASRQSRLR